MRIVESFKNRLNYAITIRNMRAIELSTKTGISKSQLSNYMAGRYEPKTDGLQILATALNVSPTWLMGYDVPMENNNKNTIKLKNDTKLTLVPVLGKISAGLPLLAEENIECYLPIINEMYNFTSDDELFFLKVNGESMNKVVNNGAYVLVKKQNTAEDGDVVAVLVGDDEATLKTFKQLDVNIISLEPNSTYDIFKPLVIDITKTDFKILGKVIGDFKKW